jgi:hypothetical protein
MSETSERAFCAGRFHRLSGGTGSQTPRQFHSLPRCSCHQPPLARRGHADRCGDAARVIACIEDRETIDPILTHLRQKEQELPTLPLLVPPTRVPPGTLPLVSAQKSPLS